MRQNTPSSSRAKHFGEVIFAGFSPRRFGLSAGVGAPFDARDPSAERRVRIDEEERRSARAEPFDPMVALPD